MTQPFRVKSFSKWNKSVLVEGFGLTLRVDFDDTDTVETHRRILALVDHLNEHPPTEPAPIPGVNDPDDDARDAAQEAYWKSVEDDKPRREG